MGKMDLRPKKRLKGPFRRRIPRHDPDQTAITAAAMAVYLAKGGTITQAPASAEPRHAPNNNGRWWRPRP